MLIREMYRDNTYDMVEDIVLDDLIQSEKILKFYRAGHWAVIASDPIRGMGGNGTGYRRRYETRLSPIRSTPFVNSPLIALTMKMRG